MGWGVSPIYKERIINENAGAIIYAELSVNSALAMHLMSRGLEVPTPIPLKALIDTGANLCAIVPGLAQRLNLLPHARVAVMGIGEKKANPRHAYYVGFNLFGTESFDVYATEFEINFGNGVNALIGRDLLNRLKLFCYDGKNDSFTLEI